MFVRLTKPCFSILFAIISMSLTAQNNTCENAKQIDLKPDGQSTSIPIDHRNSTLVNDPECYTNNNLIADSYYTLVAPPSGVIRFDYQYSYGINIFDNCYGASLFCDYVTSGIIEVDNLQPGSTFLLQVFQSDPSNDYCNNAELIDIKNLSFNPKDFKLDKTPACSVGEIYSDVFYKFIVPQSGAVSLSRYIDNITNFYGYEYEFFYGGIALYSNCNEAPIFCKANESILQSFNFDSTYENYGSIIIADLNPKDTLILQLFSEIDSKYTTTFEVADTNFTPGQCHIDDWKALKALYENTNGNHWTNNDGWEQVTVTNPQYNCNLSLLYGVNLNTDGRVYCLDLDGVNDCTFVEGSNGNNLVGTLTYDMQLLTELTDLCLNNNKISGDITSITRWLSRNLKQLLLHNNKLTGEMSNSLFDLDKLEKLYLSSNNISGDIPYTIGQCKNLTHLGLYENQLSEDIPDLSELTNLQILNLRDNQLTGPIPIELSEIQTLKGLYISNNLLKRIFN